MPEEVKQSKNVCQSEILASSQIKERQFDTNASEHQSGQDCRQKALLDVKEPGDRKKRARQKLKRLEVVEIDEQTKDSSQKESSPLECESVASVTLNFDQK